MTMQTSSAPRKLDAIKRLSNGELILNLEKLVQSERKITHLILIHILEVDSRRLYAELGFDSMFSYLTRGLKYSESSAQRRLQSARLLKSLDENSRQETLQKIEQGQLNLSQLSLAQRGLNLQCPSKMSETKSPPSLSPRTLLKKLENKTHFESQ